MLRRAALGVLAAAALVAGACGGSGGGSGGGDETADAAGQTRTEELPIETTVTIRGDLTASLDKQVVRSRLAMVRTPPSAGDTRLFGIETVAPVKAGKVAFIVGFGLTDYDGDGQYRIPEGSLYDAAKSTTGKAGEQPKIGSSLQIIWWPTGDLSADPQQFARRAKECTVDVEDKGERGKLSCPDLTQDGSTKHFSLEMTWRVAGPPFPTTTMPTPPMSTPPTTGAPAG